MLIAGCYLGLALWCLRPVLSHPASTIATSTSLPRDWQQITAADQKLVVAVVAAHGRALAAPTTLLDGPQCHPLRRALMLGQHELAEGLLGAVPYILSRDPVLTYNAAMVLAIALAGIAMHALVRTWTGEHVAAAVAGTLFAVHPARIGDLVHLSAVGNYWTVASLLCLTTFFARPTWMRALALGVTTSAQLLESIYPLVPHAMIFGTLALWLAWRHRRELSTLAPKLAVAATMVLATAVVVLGPYLTFKSTWGALAGRQSLLYPIGELGFGGGAYSGTIALVLALVGLLDRVRWRAADVRPQWPLLFAGLLVAWSAVIAVPIPGVGIELPSLFRALATIVPGLDAIRRGGAVILGWHLVVIVLAGFGVAALARGRTPIVRAGLGIALTALAVAEVFVPRVARATFGRTFALAAYRVRPPDVVLALYDRIGPGAVLDVPYERGPGRFYRQADFVLAGAFHRQRVAACYNSFAVPIQDDVTALAARVFRDAPAADALAALGVRNVLYHFGIPSRTNLVPPNPLPPHLEEVGRAADQILYRITGAARVTEATAALDVTVARRATPAGAFEIVFRNHDPALFRHPDPIEPSMFVVRWYGDAPTPLAEERAGILLPTALPSGEELRRAFVPSNAPAAARRVTIATAADPDRVVATLDLGT